MKLTEKELNEFPIGTMLITNKWYIIKTDCNTGYKNWYKVSSYQVYGWFNANDISKWNIDTVQIPKQYKKYIPPKPILDDKEKEWFNFVRPFRNRVIGIFKSKYCGDEYIGILIKNNKQYTMCFPSFKSGTMYKGMKLDREYSLEELGI